MTLWYGLKRAMELARSVPVARELVSHDQWTPQELEMFKQKRLRSLVKYAMRHSAFYKDFYSHIKPDEDFTLHDLPILDKNTMIENYDRFVTDPRLKLRDLEGHLSNLVSDQHYLGEYRVLSTGGSSGATGVFAFNRREWISVLASNQRMGSYMDVTPRMSRRLRVSAVGAHHPRHVTARVPEAMASPFVVFQRLYAAEPITGLVKSLNAFQPEVLFAYPSAGAALAMEQLEGRLQINPRVVWVSSEVCTRDMKQKMKAAWGTSPYEVYALTEAVFFGANCEQDRGIHAFEDLAILEVVDEENGPVPDGAQGHKALITNLYYYTQPLIRYEVSDMLQMSQTLCPCGRPFRLIEHIEGRSDDILQLKGLHSESVLVHPISFREVLGAFAELRQYQIVYKAGELHLNLVPRDSQGGEALVRRVESAVKQMLEALNAECPALHVQLSTEIAREQDEIGKLKLIKQLSPN